MNGCIYRTEFDVCKKYTTDKVTSFCVGRNCLDRKESNADRIRSMTDEELAKWRSRGQCPTGHYHGDYDCMNRSCKDCWLEWLKENDEI